ncbi:MAG: hypothetical protein GY862_18595 [Gammaproteobacteria bacterium]|nr:hypothetical protein [Gammaproteobacteria bacterium]
MQWHVNDLSLDGQFADARAFRAALEPLLALRRRDPVVRERLYCSRTLHTRPVTANADFRQAVYSLADRNFKQLVLTWLTQQGPFWNDARQANPDDYFEYQGEDITDQGLGETARRQLAGIDAWTFSFTGSRFVFTTSPLRVQHGLAEDPFGFVDVENHWTLSDLAQAAQSICPEACNWNEVMAEARQRFDGLLLADTIESVLQPQPFSHRLAERIFELLKILECIVVESDGHGKLSDRGIDIVNKHFVGEEAWFSGESNSNKRKFKQALTFPDPANPDHPRLLCPWHGKIKTPQFRIHFEWPRPAGQKRIKVAYIGPKITKH